VSGSWNMSGKVHKYVLHYFASIIGTSLSPLQIESCILLTTTDNIACNALRKQIGSNTNRNLSYLLTYLIAYLLTYSMEQRLPWEANRFSACQEINCILWNPKIHYRHLSLSWTRSTQSMPPQPTSWRSILILYSHLRFDLRSSLFLRYPQQNPV
jgi:hypothetical protein